MSFAIGFVVGLLVGMGLTMALMVVMMRRSMVIEQQSAHGFDATLELLQKQIEKSGWSSPGQWDMAESAASKGVDMGRRVVNISLCNPPYAKRVLEQMPQMSVMMPCTFSVYTKADGKTYVLKLNTAMMGKMMGGAVAEVMGGYVAAEEEQILAPVVAKS